MRDAQLIINSQFASVFRDPPKLSPQQQELLIQWLKLVDGEAFPPVFISQLEMIDCLTTTEGGIQDLTRNRKELKVQVPALKQSGQLDEIRQIQKRITKLEEEIAQLNYFRHCILFVGDTIAAHVVDVDAIRHFALYPAPGFIGGKEGLKAEIEAATTFAHQGQVVVFNDLTHCLHLGDLTLKKGEKVSTFEVKSNAKEYFKPETMRQIILPMHIHKYIEEDVATAFPKFVDQPFAQEFATKARDTKRPEPPILSGWIQISRRTGIPQSQESCSKP